jgi:hypothetical protein
MIVHETSSESDIDDASLALMVKKTTKMLKSLIRVASSSMARRRSSSQVAIESLYLKWIATIVVNLVI